MEIIWNRVERFCDLYVTELFACDSLVYMKLGATDYTNACGISPNAIRMYDGELVYFESDEQVTKVSGKLVVE